MSKSKYLSFVVIALMLFVLLPSKTHAQDDVSLGFAPTVEYLQLEPGEVYEGKFTVWNLRESTNTFYLYVSGFEQVENYPGTAVPLTPEDDAKDPYSASPWVKADTTELELVPQKNFDINYTIRVPADVALGEYHVKIFLTTEKSFTELKETTTFANLASGPNILVQIGDTDELNEDLDLINFYTEKYIFDKPPVSLLVDMQNTGNTHISPKGDIVLTNIFGTEIARIPFNHDGVSMLRGQEATYENEWQVDRQVIDRHSKFVAGPIKARLVLQYKTINPGYFPITSETTFWIIPWKLMLAFIGSIGLIVIGFKIKGNNKK